MLKALRDIKITTPLVSDQNLQDFKIPAHVREKLHYSLNGLGYSLDNFTSYAITDKERDGKIPNYAIIPNQYFAYAASLYDFAIELYEYFNLFDKIRQHSHLFVGSAREIHDNINSNDSIKDNFSSEEDIELFSHFFDRDDDSYRLGAKQIINDKGKARSSKDCFGSVILKAINLPDVSSSAFGRLVYDLCSYLDVYKTLVEFYKDTQNKIINKPNIPLEQVISTLGLFKPFLLFAGISGTGKTRFIREQVKDYPDQKNYCLVPVRPDWHEPSDLLGYISRISGKKEYVSTPVLHFITQAWIHIYERIGEVRADGKIGLSQEQLDHIPPFWLCLDEMNLAPVEQYFADYLSVLETRHWYTSPELTEFNDNEGVDYGYVYQCDPLLKADTLSQQLDENARTELAEKLGLDLNIALHQQIWASFCQHGIAIPFNLMVAGTVNMDETTHGFSRKVIDRALTFDFNEFFPNDFDAYFAPALQPKRLGYPTWSDGRAITDIPELEKHSKESVTFLKAVNGVLQQSPFELAYRALNELMLALLAHHPANTAELVAIWDDFMMCKVLPRIEGDSDKLRSHLTADGDLLTDLEKVLAEQFGSHWDNTRPDLFNRKVAAAGEDSAPAEPPHVPCRSKKKLAWMKERLTRQCFTSFWP
ncbi:McrB family protein [Aeromonas veronii]